VPLNTHSSPSSLPFFRLDCVATLHVALVTYHATTSKKQVVQVVKLHVFVCSFSLCETSATQHSTLDICGWRPR